MWVSLYKVNIFLFMYVNVRVLMRELGSNALARVPREPSTTVTLPCVAPIGAILNFYTLKKFFPLRSSHFEIPLRSFSKGPIQFD